MKQFVPQWIIEKKREGNALDEDEIRFFINGFTDGSIPVYQMAALAMCIYFQGMNARETAALTDVMMRSGDCITFEGSEKPTADKHSTGGIGDKISLMLAPLAAAAGMDVPMISGRGLGITGGTLDKLESIPGYNTRLSVPEFKEIVQKVGCSIIGQTDRLAPADKKLYALRDVTGTVPSIPLITASIMSKKLAEGARTLVFDVKCGTAAFMRDFQNAQTLAKNMTSVGKAMGRKTGFIISEMSQPLGRTAGNAVEVSEAVETLKGKGPADTRLLTLELTAKMAVLSGIYSDREEAIKRLTEKLDQGAALEKFEQMVVAQGGDPAFIDKPGLLPQPGATEEILAEESGTVANVDAKEIGKIVLRLGGGRQAVTDTVDLAAGIDHLVQQGEAVEKGQPIMRLRAKDAATIQPFIAAAKSAVEISDGPVGKRKLILAESAEGSPLKLRGGKEGKYGKYGKWIGRDWEGAR